MVKLKDILKESEEFQQLPNEIKKHFLEIISTYGNHRESITRKSDIRETAETLGAIADAAQEYTLREGGDWFDRVTIKRNMKELKGLCERFGKEASLAKEQEQRLEALYEDMGHVLSRYFEIAEVSEAMMRERLGIKEKKSINEASSTYKDWDEFVNPDYILVTLKNGKKLYIQKSRIKGGKNAYQAILQAFNDNNYKITDKIVGAMVDKPRDKDEDGKGYTSHK